VIPRLPELHTVLEDVANALQGAVSLAALVRRQAQMTTDDAVKLEGGLESLGAVKAIAGIGIPVMGHVGLTPQTAGRFGGFRVRGRDRAGAEQLMRDARALQEAGCFAVVLECVPAVVARKVTRSLRIPTVGIGSGPWCDGQVLVTHDLLGYYDRFQPKFVKRYAQMGRLREEAMREFKREVELGQFPTPAHSYAMAGESEGRTRRARGLSAHRRPRPAASPASTAPPDRRRTASAGSWSSPPGLAGR